MYKELKDGKFYEQDISYSTLMKKHIKKHSSYLQPIFEAISNSLEATSGSGDCITIRLNFSKTTCQGKFEFSSIDIIDTGIGFNDENLTRLKCLYDESKGQNNLGTSRVQYLHFFHNTDIYSVFEENGRKMKRRIALSKKFLTSSHNAVIWLGNKTEDVENITTGTTLSFYSPIDDNDKVKYAELRPQQLKEYILVHYLSRLCLKNGNLQEFKIEQYMNGVHDVSNDCYIRDNDIPNADYEDFVTIPYSLISVDGKSIIKSSNTEKFEITTFYSYLIGENFTLNEVRRANPFLQKAYYFDYLFCPTYPVDGGDDRRAGEMYIEVIKYSTLLERAKSRNKIFTDKI